MSLQSLVFLSQILCRHSIDWSQWSESEIWSGLQGSVHLRSWIRVQQQLFTDKSSCHRLSMCCSDSVGSDYTIWIFCQDISELLQVCLQQLCESLLYWRSIMMPIHLVNLRFESALLYMTVYCVKGPDFESDFKFWIESTCTKISIQHENWSMENCLSRNLDVQAQIRFWVCLKSVHTERSAQDQYILPAVPDRHTGQQ